MRWSLNEGLLYSFVDPWPADGLQMVCAKLEEDTDVSLAFCILSKRGIALKISFFICL